MTIKSTLTITRREAKETFGVTVTAKLRHAILWAARKQFGSTTALAAYLGVNQTQVGMWINLRSMPNLKHCFWQSRKGKMKLVRLEKKLLKLTGYLLEDIFPPALRSSDFLDHQKELELTREVSLLVLEGTGLLPALPPASDKCIDQDELRQAVAEILETLTPREGEIIKLRFGMSDGVEHTFQEVADLFQLSSGRIQQIETKALRKLRHPSRSKLVRGYLE